MQMQLKRSVVQSFIGPAPAKPKTKPFPWPSLRAILAVFATAIVVLLVAGFILLWKGVYDFDAAGDNIYRTNRFTGEAEYFDGGDGWHKIYPSRFNR